MYKKITQVEAKKIMDTRNDIEIVDVRDDDEYDQGHIDGAVLMPVECIDEKLTAAKLPDKSKTVLVYCRSGRRSMEAAEKLDRLGYKNVLDFGGLIDWQFEIVL